MSLPDPAEVDAIVDSIWPTLQRAMGGLDPNLQGAVLADLVATWLAGHTGESQRAVNQLREELLELHVEFVRKLIPVNERKLMERVLRR